MKKKFLEVVRAVAIVAFFAGVGTYVVVTVLPVLVICGAIVMATACGGSSSILIFGLACFTFFFVLGLVISPFVRAFIERRKNK